MVHSNGLQRSPNASMVTQSVATTMGRASNVFTQNGTDLIGSPRVSEMVSSFQNQAGISAITHLPGSSGISEATHLPGPSGISEVIHLPGPLGISESTLLPGLSGISEVTHVSTPCMFGSLDNENINPNYENASDNSWNVQVNRRAKKKGLAPVFVQSPNLLRNNRRNGVLTIPVHQSLPHSHG